MVKKSTAANPVDEDISRLYRRAEHQLPPSRIDAAVLQAARAAVTPRRSLARSPFSSAWTVPTSVAAVLVLSVALVVFMSNERGVTVVSEPSPVPAQPAVAETGAQEGNPSTSAPVIESAVPPAPATEPAPPPAAAARRSAAPPSADNRKAPVQPQPPAATARPDERVFGTLKPFGKTMPTPSTQSADEQIASVAPRRLYPDVVSVQVKGTAGAYDFTVKIQGVGTDCSHYVDWWEVLSEDGRLLYRNVLPPPKTQATSFVGAGGPVRIDAETVVWVRAHGHPAGYGPAAFKGSPRAGFHRAEMRPDFAADVANKPPLPSGCTS